MKFKIFFILILYSHFIIGQEKKVSGVILNEDLSIYENKIKIYDRDKGLLDVTCLLYTSPSPRDRTRSRMPSSA